MTIRTSPIERLITDELHAQASAALPPTDAWDRFVESIDAAADSAAANGDEIRDGDLIDYVPPLPSTASDSNSSPKQKNRRTRIVAAVAAAILLVAGVAVVVADRDGGDVVTDPVDPPSVADPVAPPSVADPAVSPTVTDSLGYTWSRVPLDEAVFGEAELFSVTAGGPGLVAVGSVRSGDDEEAAVWTSVDGITWSRVPHDEAVFGGGGTYMSDVIAGGPGLVAVGWDSETGGAAWTSVDGFIWSRVPHDLANLGDDGPPGVTVGGPGLVAVGQAGGDAAVWTSVDGLSWSRVPHDEAVFGGTGEAGMFDVTVGGPGLVAVGGDWVEGGGLDGDDGVGSGVVWTSVDGLSWSRVPHDEAAFGGPAVWSRNGNWAITSVTAGGPGLVAVGHSGTWTSVDGLTWFNERSGPQGWVEVIATDPGLVAFGRGVWTSADGLTWSSVPRDPVFRFGGPIGVTLGGPGLVAVGVSVSFPAVWVAAPED